MSLSEKETDDVQGDQEERDDLEEIGGEEERSDQEERYDREEHDRNEVADAESESLSEADIQELYRRAQQALNNGYTVARGDVYSHGLGGGDDGSPAALVALCEARLGVGPEPTFEEQADAAEGPWSERKDRRRAREEMTSEGGPPSEPRSNRAGYVRDGVTSEGAPSSEPGSNRSRYGRDGAPSSKPRSNRSEFGKDGVSSEPADDDDSAPVERRPGVGYRLKGVVGTLEEVIETLPPSSSRVEREAAAAGEPTARTELKEALEEISDDGDDASRDDSPEYESWSKKKLVALAEEKKLDINSHMTKAEVIVALRAGG